MFFYHPDYFKQKSVVITGAASGIGRATAVRFARKGARISLIDTNPEGLRDIKHRLEAEGAEVRTFNVDVTSEVKIRETFATIAQEAGGVDVLVNNAAVSVYGEIREVPINDARRVMEVNYFGQLICLLSALPYLEAPGSLGRIVGVGSVLAEITAPLNSAYVASKHALQGLYKVLHEELRHQKSKVRVSTILPSSIATPLFQNTKTYLGVEPKVFPPYYSPFAVADVILERVRRPAISTVVGNAGSFFIFMFRLFPAPYHWFQSKVAYHFQRTEKPKSPQAANNLDDPIHQAGEIYGDHKIFVPAIVARLLRPRNLFKIGFIGVAAGALASALGRRSLSRF